MMIDVDMALCAGHGQCEFAAPEVFSLDDDAELHYVTDPGSDHAGDVRRAARACPTRAIRVVE
jgi:ferredoxin